MVKPFIRDDVADFLAGASEAPPLNTLPLAAVRVAMRDIGVNGDIAPVPLSVVRDLTFPGPDGPVALRLYDQLDRRGAGPLILFFHGGGFVFGDLVSHDAVCRTLARQSNLPVLAVDYRLAPEHPFPAFAQDAEEAARWVASLPDALGLTPTGIITCGDSAGGHLAILVAQRLAAVPAPLPVLAQWAMYPFVGGGHDWPSMREFGEGYMLTRTVMDWFDMLSVPAPEDSRYALLAQPVPNVPLLVQTASLDPLRDQGRAYALKAQEAGARVVHIEAEGMIHGYINLRRALPSAQADVETFISQGLALIADL